MPDSRVEQRNKKRLSVKFGHDQLDYMGYVSDISSQGFFVESRTVYKPGVVLSCALTTRDRETVLLEGRVQWAKQGDPRLKHIMKTGMGIYILKFLQGEDEYKALNNVNEHLSA